MRDVFPDATTADDIGCFICKPINMDLVSHVKRARSRLWLAVLHNVMITQVIFVFMLKCLSAAIFQIWGLVTLANIDTNLAFPFFNHLCQILFAVVFV
jgi:hypothetical protein